MCDELLGDVHPFQKLLEETICKTLLDRGNVLLHVLQTPKDGEKRESGRNRKRTDVVKQSNIQRT